MKLNIQLFGGRGASSGSVGKRELDSLEYYVSGEGMWINQYLRGDEFGGKLTENEKEFLKDLEKITNNNSVKEDVLYRTVDANAIFGNMDDFAFGELKDEIIYNVYSKGKGTYSQNKAREINNKINNVIGKTITEKGFMSTTKSLNIAENNMYNFGSTKPVILEIRGTKGTKGYDVMKKASKRLREVEKAEPQKEVLLAKNKKYKVNSISNKNGNIYIKVKLV